MLGNLEPRVGTIGGDRILRALRPQVWESGSDITLPGCSGLRLPGLVARADRPLPILGQGTGQWGIRGLWGQTEGLGRPG